MYAAVAAAAISRMNMVPPARLRCGESKKPARLGGGARRIGRCRGARESGARRRCGGPSAPAAGMTAGATSVGSLLSSANFFSFAAGKRPWTPACARWQGATKQIPGKSFMREPSGPSTPRLLLSEHFLVQKPLRAFWERVLMHPDRQDFGGELHLVPEAIAVIGGPRDQPQEQKQPKTQHFEEVHALRRQQILMRDMHDPFVRVRGQIDLMVPRHVGEITLDIGLLHEAEAQFDADHAAAAPVAVEDRHVVAVVMDIRDLGMHHLDNDEVARKNAVAIP